MAERAAGQQPWQPATFAERGVALPFTTPQLAGTRARRSAQGLDLIVPHPAGARGVYIMPCQELANFCPLTLHDLRLSEVVRRLPAVTPGEIRAAARRVAAEGAAGRTARAAAGAAGERERQERLLANATLLRLLIAQAERSGSLPAADLAQRGKMAILKQAALLRRTPEALTHDLETLAGLYAGIGFAGGQARSRTLLTLEGVAGVHAALLDSVGGLSGRCAIAASLVVEAAASTLAVAAKAMAEAQARAGNLPALLADWGREPDATAAFLSRPDWVLDGWREVALVWQLAEQRRCAERGASPRTIGEMALMVPVMPQEAAAWLGAPLDDRESRRLRGVVQAFEDWRTGSVAMDLIGRNERIRALAA